MPRAARYRTLSLSLSRSASKKMTRIEAAKAETFSIGSRDDAARTILIRRCRLPTRRSSSSMRSSLLNMRTSVCRPGPGLTLAEVLLSVSTSGHDRPKVLWAEVAPAPDARGVRATGSPAGTWPFMPVLLDARTVSAAASYPAFSKQSANVLRYPRLSLRETSIDMSRCDRYRATTTFVQTSWKLDLSDSSGVDALSYSSQSEKRRERKSFIISPSFVMSGASKISG
mmetsp:Transcript_10941/g.40902  ORF Transcript_10941/g.40902 Transcript_10941/m.40902 type:complete len:227 (-) Transcript_10941:56-736(-)